MKKIFAIAMIASLALTSCGDEDDIKPRNPEECYFENTYGSSAADLQLQADFFSRNKIYVPVSYTHLTLPTTERV